MAGSRGRVLGPLLAAVLVVAVIVVVVLNVTGGKKKDATPGGGGAAKQVTTVRLLVGSETEPYLTSPEVSARLAALGYRIEVDTAGSQEIATRDLTGYDLALPSNATQAQDIRNKLKLSQAATVLFSTPMAVGTFQPIVDLLSGAGVVRTAGGVSFLDMAAYLKLVHAETRWSQLPSNRSYQTEKSVLINSTDVATSNSAALYLAIASYVANGNNVVADKAKAQDIADKVAPIFTRQGFKDPSSQGPFNTYLSSGMGAAPLVMIYESQYRAAEVAHQLRDDMRLLYPSPTVYARHTAVPLTDKGNAVTRLLATDNALQDLAARYGFQTPDPAHLKATGIAAPPSLVDVIDPPALEISATMIARIRTQK